MIQIPIQAIPSQTFNVLLGGQYCQINLYQKTQGLFFDLNVNGIEIVSGVICRENLRLVRETYHGFLGNLIIYDLQGKQDPIYTGLGTRWVLCYLTEAENAAII